MQSADRQTPTKVPISIRFDADMLAALKASGEGWIPITRPWPSSANASWRNLADLFVQILQIAREMKLLKLGKVSLDGTKIHADASRHSALSYGHLEKLEAQLQAEVKELFALATKADGVNTPDGVKLPAELKRREDRLAVMFAAKARMAARAAERDQREQAEYDEKMARRAARQEETGRKPG